MSAGLLGQLGVKSESVWGTAVTVDKFEQAWLSGVPSRNQPPLMSMGIRAGRYMPTCLSTGPKDVKGTINMELNPAPLASLLRHMHGTIATTGAGPYVHTASFGALRSQSFTAQFGVPGTSGTVYPFTFAGCKIPKWSIKAKAGEIAQLSFDITAKDYVTATALASASYGTTCSFTFAQGTVSVAGSQVGTVKDVELDVTRPLRTGKDGTFLGSVLIAEQLGTGRVDARIKVTNEFEDLTIHDLANTGVAIVLTFTNGTETLAITTNAWIEPFTPDVAGVDSLSTSSFESICYGATDASALTSVLTNSESTDA